MPAGTKVITLDFEIAYSDGGQYATTNTIALAAPGIDKFHIFTTMRAHVLDAMFSMAKRAAEIQGLDAAKKAAANDDDEEDGADSETSGREFFNQICLGLGPDRFPNFAAYAKKTLTNAPKLARVGEGSAPITDEVWEQLEEHGGLDAIAEVIGTFSGFFSVSQTAKKKTGSAKPSSSSLDSKAASASNTRTKSRSQN